MSSNGHPNAGGHCSLLLLRLTGLLSLALCVAGRRSAQFQQEFVAGLQRNPHLLSDHVVLEPLVGWVSKALCFGYFWVGRTPLVHLVVRTFFLLCLLVVLAFVLHFVLLCLLLLCLALLGLAASFCVCQGLTVAHPGGVGSLVCLCDCALVFDCVCIMDH